jgi:hypothetical protein
MQTTTSTSIIAEAATRLGLRRCPTNTSALRDIAYALKQQTPRNSVDSINTTDDDEAESFIVGTFNIQSLVAHNLDLSSDPDTSLSDLLGTHGDLDG